MNTAGAQGGNPLFSLQQALYTSRNYTRRRLHQTRLRWVSAAISAHAATTSTLRAMEYGPGSGIYLPLLARYFTEVLAADVEEAYLSGIRSAASEVPGMKLVVDDVQDSAFPENSFDLVLCSEVLEHVPRPDRALQTLHRILRPSGIAVVTTPQRYSLMELCCKVALLPGVIDLVRLIYREPVLETGHISLRSCAPLMRCIQKSGFEIVEHAKFGLYLPLLAEFGGAWGGRAIEGLERKLAATSANHLFWTQAYVLRKPM